MADTGNSTLLLVGLGTLAAAGLVAVAISKASRSSPSTHKGTTLERASAVSVRRIADAVPPLGAPLAAPVTTRFGNVSNLHADGHHGLDLGIPIGRPVYAPVDGIVSGTTINGVGWGKGNGNSVALVAAGYRWQFLHLSHYVVAKGQQVKRGQIIGYTGNTGRSTGPHLHVQVTDIQTGIAVDPQKVYPEGTFEPTVSAPASVAEIVEVQTIDGPARTSTWWISSAGAGHPRISRRRAA